MKKFMKSTIMVILAALICICGFTACGDIADKGTDGGTITVKDQLDRTVEIPANVEKIVSSYTISTSLLIALGLEEKLVGIEISAEDRLIYRKAAPEIIKLPAVGSGKTFNIEECVRLKPDLVIMPDRMKEFIDKLETLGIPVIAVAPEDMPSFIETVRLVGKAAGAEKRADELVEFYNQKIRMIEEAVSGSESKPVIYLAGSKSPLTTCTREMYQNYLIGLAGGENASEEIEEGYWANVSMEQVLAWNPDIIVSVQYSAFKDEEILNDPKWQSINAVREGKVFRFPSPLEPWDYPTPSSVLGMLWLTGKLHPEAYSHEQFLQDARGFYKEFYDIDVTDEELGSE